MQVEQSKWMIVINKMSGYQKINGGGGYQNCGVKKVNQPHHQGHQMDWVVLDCCQVGWWEQG